MERSEMLKKHAILNHISSLPQRLLASQDNHNLTEFILHELCYNKCFDFKKAAYLVDNPDFDCLKGIAGFSSNEAYPKETIWETPELFIQHMEKAEFNKKVRNILKPSMARSNKSDAEITKMVSEYLGLQKPVYCSWKMRHDNHGILIYEKPEDQSIPDEIILNGACLLGFCPIY